MKFLRLLSLPVICIALIVSEAVPAEITTFEIGNGLRFIQGQSLNDFKKQHAGSECFESTFVGCEIAGPQLADCPSVQMCDHVVYYFQERKLDGFAVEYPSAVWRQLLATSTKQFGRSEHTTAHIGSMGVEVSKWKLPGSKDLIFTHYSGTDFNGGPIAKPFSVHYGSDADSK